MITAATDNHVTAAVWASSERLQRNSVDTMNTVRHRCRRQLEPVLELPGGEGGRVEPPWLIGATPYGLVNFNSTPSGGSPQHPSSLAMNGLLLIITRPPSTTHCIPYVMYGFLTAFGYK